MFKSLTLPACLAAALVAANGEVNGQGVVREGVRRTTEAAAEGGRAAVRGSRSVINRAGQATRDAVGRSTEATRNQVDRRYGNTPRVNSGAQINADGNIDANTSVGSGQIQADAGLDANGQPLQANRQLQAQGGIDSADQQQRYESGYRGIEDQGYVADQQFANQPQHSSPMAYGGRTYVLRHDSYGREFICVAGRAVYFDNQQAGQAQPHEAYKLGDDQQYGRQFNDQQYSDDQLQRDGQFQQDQYQQRDVQRNTFAPQDGYGQPPAPPVPAQSGVNSAAPASSNLDQATGVDASSRQELDSANDSQRDSSSSVEANSQSRAESDVTANTNADSSAATDEADQSDQSASSSDSAGDEAAGRSSGEESDDSSSNSNDDASQ